MRHLSISGFPVIEPEEADPELALLYAEAQQETGLPFVPNWAKIGSVSPECLDLYLTIFKAFNQKITLPQSLVPMILYSIANARSCTYCTASNEMFCRTLGVDDDTLEKVANDLGSVSPASLQAIIQFALQCAFDSQGLTAVDYERVREQGISDDEIAQIIFLAALANFNDTLADSFKMEVEPGVLDALGR
jgi:alkylhydroperoxidase family enzyme